MSVERFGKVAVLFGGTSAEREVSLKSGQAVLDALLGAGVDAHAFDPANAELTELVAAKFQRVLIMLHGRGGEDGTLQGALQQLGIPYTGSGVLGSALCMDKVRSKWIWQALGLPTAEYQVVDKSSFNADLCGDILSRLGGIVMVKPANEGSSIGMAKVSTATELQEAVTQAFQFDHQVLLERFITGQEFTVSLLGDNTLPSIRMQTPRTFYDYEAKYQSDTTQYFCPSGLDGQRETQLGELARQAFAALGGSGWGRVDFMQDKDGQFYLLEANTVPGMTQKSLVPMAAKQAGMSFTELALEVLATSEVRR
ncbi:D-alanine--D-alanine ligase [Bowmanella yangjiangensis]|uniref:D-alanine--D-alanine ligase n=1 Tax=Bowmanella yangjiangensis TaxID=2811230 RepID=A0ABS3CMB7_9ALTE|nr:D-alanine--D-alanine ligase [Bowmanella yangjiangensis]MBN7818238.1 D-alanine--D-alanine ligase [Bowmanella yangjiangensis]